MHNYITTYDNISDDEWRMQFTYLIFPKIHWRKLPSTNVLERFNKEIKRRTKVIGVFANEGSILRYNFAMIIR